MKMQTKIIAMINKCTTCANFDTFSGSYLEGDDLEQGLCRKFNGMFTFGYRGKKDIRELCSEYEDKPKRSLLNRRK
jgi:hypothetical protein